MWELSTLRLLTVVVASAAFGLCAPMLLMRFLDYLDPDDNWQSWEANDK